MPDLVETMMYAGETPWHRKGTFVGDAEVTSDVALVKAGLDWTVEKRPVYIPTVVAGAELDVNAQVRVPRQSALVRADTGAVLSVMSDGYTPVQNANKFSFMDALVGEQLAMYHTAGSLDGGSRVFVACKLPGSIRLDGKPTEEIDRYLLLADSFDGSIAFQIMWTGVRVVCANTLNAAVMADGQSAFKMRHAAGIEAKIADARKALGLANRAFAAFADTANFLVRTSYTDDHLRFLAGRLFDNRDQEGGLTTYAQAAQEKLLDLFENGKGHQPIRGTAWAAVQAVAEWTDHARFDARRPGARSADAQANSILFGDAARVKAQASGIIFDQVAGTGAVQVQA